LFDEQDLAEISDPDYPGEGLVVCRNPLGADERERKRADLLEGTERELDKILARGTRQKSPLAGKDRIGIAVGKVVNRYKMAKHFKFEIVAPAQRSLSAKRKASSKRCADGFPVHSFQTLLDDLVTITSNTVGYSHDDAPDFERITIPTPTQQRALDLLRVRVNV